MRISKGGCLNGGRDNGEQNNGGQNNGRQDNGGAFRMPGEFERHWGCMMIWPVRPGSWIYGGKEAKSTFCRIADAIAADEKLFIADKTDERATIITLRSFEYIT